MCQESPHRDGRLHEGFLCGKEVKPHWYEIKGIFSLDGFGDVDYTIWCQDENCCGD